MKRSNPILQAFGLMSVFGGVLLIFASELSVAYMFVAVGTVFIAMSGPLANWTLVVIAASANGVPVVVNGLTIRIEYLAFPLLFLLVFQLRNNRQGFRRHRGVSVIAVAGSSYVAWSLLISASAPSPISSYFVVAQYAAGLLALCLLLCTNVDRSVLVKRATLVLGLISMLSLLGYIGSAMGLTSAIGVSSSGRTLGFSFEPNIYASQAVLWLGVMYYWRSRLALIHKIAGLPILATVFTAGTRAAWLALAMMVVLMMLGTIRRRPGSIAVFGVVLVAFSFIGPAILPWLDATGWFGPEITYRLENLFETESGTGSYRLSHYEMAFADISNSNVWWQGFGANTFSQFHPVDSTGVGPAYLGSLWITLIYDSGIVGTIMFVVALGSAFMFAQRRSESLLIVAAIAICAAFTNFMWFQYAWLSVAMLQPNLNSNFSNFSNPDLIPGKSRILIDKEIH